MDKVKLELLKDVEEYIPPIIPITEDDIGSYIEKTLVNNIEISQYIDKNGFLTQIGENSYFKFVIINIVLQEKSFYLERIVFVIRRILVGLDINKLKKEEIRVIEIDIGYKTPSNKRIAILRFTIEIDSILLGYKLTQEALRTAKPVYDLQKIAGLHCGWFFLKRFSDESDAIWNIFQTHPHCCRT